MKARYALALVFSLSANNTLASEPPDWSLDVHMVETGETETITYGLGGDLSEASLVTLNRLLLGKTVSTSIGYIDIETIQFLYAVKEKVREKTSIKDPQIHIISSYRSAEYNEERRTDDTLSFAPYIAKDSQHIQGKAIDFYIPGVSSEELRDIAWCLQKGGVGHYPTLVEEYDLPYIHIDTGRIRFWGSDFNFNTIDCETS